jgi:hypothetical protein
MTETDPQRKNLFWESSQRWTTSELMVMSIVTQIFTFSLGVSFRDAYTVSLTPEEGVCERMV